jgi:hypothetical protein
MRMRSLPALALAATLLTLALPGSATAQSDTDKDTKIKPTPTERTATAPARSAPTATEQPARPTANGARAATSPVPGTGSRTLAPSARAGREPNAADRTSRLSPPRGWGEPARWTPGSERGTLPGRDVRNATPRRNVALDGGDDQAIIERPIEYTHPTPKKPTETEPETPKEVEPVSPARDRATPAYRPEFFFFAPIYGSRYTAYRECGYTSGLLRGPDDGGMTPGYTPFSASRFGHAVLNGYGILGGDASSATGIYGGSNCASPNGYVRSFEHSQGIRYDACAEVTLQADTELEESFTIGLPQLEAYNIRDLSSKIGKAFQAGETIALWKADGERVRIAPAAADKLKISSCSAQ